MDCVVRDVVGREELIRVQMTLTIYRIVNAVVYLQSFFWRGEDENTCY